MAYKLLFENVIYEKTIHLLKLLEQASDSFCSAIATSKGIVISPMNNKYEQASDTIWSYLRHRLDKIDITHSPYILIHKACLVKKYHYAVGDDVVVENDEASGTPYKAKIREIFSHDHNMHIETYFSADYYQHVCFHETDVVDPITYMNVIKKKSSFHLMIHVFGRSDALNRNFCVSKTQHKETEDL